MSAQPNRTAQGQHHLNGRLIDRGGFASVTLQGIAAEAGFANGLVRHYFATKNDVLTAAFGRAYENTGNRMREAMAGRTGLEAVRLLMLELLPLDDERVLEAKVVVAFWDHAASTPRMADVHRDATRTWQRMLTRCFDEAVAAGEMRSDLALDVVADELIWLAYGAQVMPVLMPEASGPERQLAVLDSALGRLRSADAALSSPVPLPRPASRGYGSADN